MLSLLIGRGLRRAELLGLAMNSIQLREEHWVIADLVGKGGHIRTVPIPLWVKKAVDAWTEAAQIACHGVEWLSISCCPGNECVRTGKRDLSSAKACERQNCCEGQS
jgi:site-specific recombinase XerC